MINTRHLQNLEQDAKSFLSAEPFSHIVIDNFIGDEDYMKQVVDEVRQIPNETYDFNEYKFVQQKKRGMAEIDKMPPLLKKLVEFCLSQEMLDYLEKLTGIQNLIADRSLLGGGIHKLSQGGHLAVHADFNRHIHTGHHRRINALLYLNPEWKEEWGAQLELWDKNMTHICHKILPILNRMVIFRITDDAYHGHPDPMTCPEDVHRYSLAFYYYTEDRPEHEKGPFHWADWKIRPNGMY